MDAAWNYHISNLHNYVGHLEIYILRPGYVITIVADLLTANIGARSSATTMLTRLWKTTQSHDLYFTSIKTGAYMYYNTGNWSSSTTRQIVSILFIHWNQITTLMMVTKIITTRTNRTPCVLRYPPPPHDYPYQWLTSDPKSKQDKVKVTHFKKLPKIQFLKFYKKLQTRHTFWGCLVPCINMKWIQPEL